MSKRRAAFAACTVVICLEAQAAPVPGGSLNPTSIPKYAEPLPVPPLMPTAGSSNAYDVAARQIRQQVLPAPLPATTVWAYGTPSDPATFSYPSFTLTATQGAPTTVRWRNQLVDAAGNFLPHLFTIDPTLHWANPAGPVDSRPRFTATPPPYTGPVPLVTHLHGGHIAPESDGFPEAWFLPAAANVVPCTGPNNQPGVGCYFTQGSNYANAPGFTTVAGQATYVYRNDQRATTLWFHDHALGMTRANVYAGLSGFYLLRDAYEASLNLPGPYGKYEIPLVIQDRSFNADGSLFYPKDRVFFDGFAGPYLPTPDISPYWNPEFFGNTMVVNGKAWPKLTVEARKYRFRLLNGSDSRWLIVKFGNKSMKAVALKLNVIGTDGGLVTGAPVALDQLPMAPGERYDVVVDFSAVAPGTRLILMNVGPDAPYGGSVTPGASADPGTTGQVMAFDVVARTAADTSVLPATLAPPSDGLEPKATITRKRTVTLTEFASAVNPAGPSEAQVGDAFGPLPWMAPISEHIAQYATEEWTIVNRTADAHPIHLHQTQFKVVSRAPIDLAAYDAAIAACQTTPTAAACPPNPDLFVKKNTKPAAPFPWEAQGQKDTLQTNPGELTKLRAYFDIQGLYVWHCHILSHEDNEMMRPICVSPDPNSPVCQK